ncbi:MAG: OmpA family protein [Bacteroidales bacterium]
MARRVGVAFLLIAALSVGWANAQTTPSGQALQGSQTQAAPTTEAGSTGGTRPATTTFFGDTGLWFVPTAELLPNGKWSVSGYRAGFNDQQGYSEIAHFAATFAAGIRDRAELFGSFRVITRIDRDLRPLFVADPAVGGMVKEYPFVTTGWTGSKVGDLLVGAKVNLTSEARQQPVAFAVRGIVKLPTGNRDAGVSTGKLDFFVDGIVSKEVSRSVELSAFGGLAYRGRPDTPVTVNVSRGFKWGFGAGFPTRSPLRVTAELTGEKLFDSSMTASAALTGVDNSLSPLTSDLRNPVMAALGVTWQHRSGFFIGGGVNYIFTGDPRSNYPYAADDGMIGRLRDYGDVQVRIGYHPGVKVYAPPPPPPTPPPAPAAPPVHQNPTVKAQCDPCTVEVGKSSAVTATAQSPDNLPLTYRWSAPTGTFANPSAPQTRWTAPDQEGSVPVTVAVDDGKGGRASDTVTIQVVRPPRKTYTFEDVHFDFDRYTLRPEATRLLDDAVTAMQQDPALTITIEGHTCNIGTAEYNLALGERRANAVRDYLASRGVSAERMKTVSYGEERPKYDNSREETRRLNRRAALVVRLQ